MISPYQILGVARTATDDEIHQAYLARLREFPPERDAERFQAIRRAYEQVRTRRLRLQRELFDTELPGMDELLEVALKGEVRQRANERQIELSIKASAAAWAIRSGRSGTH